MSSSRNPSWLKDYPPDLLAWLDGTLDAPAERAVARFFAALSITGVADAKARKACYRALWAAAVAIVEECGNPDYRLAKLSRAAVEAGLRPSSVDNKIRFARKRVGK